MKTKSKVTIGIVPEGELSDLNNFVSYIRLIEPLSAIKEKFPLKWIEVKKNPKKIDRQFIFKYLDILIIQRTPFKDKNTIQAWIEIIEKLQLNGKIFVYEIDDYFFDPNLTNLIERSSIDIIDEESIKITEYHWPLLKIADYITTTTIELANKIRPINKNIAIFPNYLELRSPKWYIKSTRYKENSIILGWTGGSRVGKDLEILPAILERIFSKYNNVYFLLGGSLKYHKLFKELPEKRILLHRWIPYSAYTSQLSYIDIGLLPMEDNSYNRCKSYLKAMDFGAMGIPVIASDVVPFNSFIKHGETGFLARGINDWVEYILLLLEEPKVRKDLGNKAKQLIWNKYNLINYIQKRFNFYKKIILKR